MSSAEVRENCFEATPRGGNREGGTRGIGCAIQKVADEPGMKRRLPNQRSGGLTILEVVLVIVVCCLGLRKQIQSALETTNVAALRFSIPKPK